MAVLSYFVLPDFPEDAKWLAEDEKEYLKARLCEDVGHSRSQDPLTFRSVLVVLKDRECFVCFNHTALSDMTRGLIS